MPLLRHLLELKGDAEQNLKIWYNWMKVYFSDFMPATTSTPAYQPTHQPPPPSEEEPVSELLEHVEKLQNLLSDFAEFCR